MSGRLQGHPGLQPSIYHTEGIREIALEDSEESKPNIDNLIKLENYRIH